MSSSITSGQNRSATAATWRANEVEWAAVAAALSLCCLLFSLWPQLDLMFSRLFLQADGEFVGNRLDAVLAVYHAVPWLGRAAGLVALAVLFACWRRPDRVAARWRRRLQALGLTMLLAVGLVINGGLKEHWGRARPSAVLAAGAQAHFEPALRPSEQCLHNCSFVSGHAATGFALMSLGMFGAPATRRRWWWIGAVAGTVVGIGRIAQGGHFLSDIGFAGVVVWACHAAIRQGWLRHRRWRLRGARR
jgi:membrane-associated PAP2 superfamily phosphatase